MIEKEIERILMGVKLTSKQKIAIDEFIELCKNNFKGRKRYVISGKGGCGKSFTLLLMSQIASAFGFKWNACCFTGKGTNVLRDRGVYNTSTIHSMMYMPKMNSKGQLIGFSRRNELPYHLILVDEFSMLDEKLVNDIESYGIPVVYMGDSKQLPPVLEEKSYLEDFVDIEFDEVVRQADGSPILKWANYLRENKRMPYNIADVNEKGSFVVLSQKYDYDIIDRLKMEVSQMIVGTNKIRNGLNLEYRERLGLKDLLCKGEIITVLKNNQSWGVFNGQDFTIKEILSEEFTDVLGIRCVNVLVSDEVEEIEMTISTECLYDYSKNPNSLYTAKKPEEYVEPIFIDYAYSKSAWKVQGSEYDSVLVFSSSMYWMTTPRDGRSKETAWENFCRALYTSASRAKKKVYFVLP